MTGVQTCALPISLVYPTQRRRPVLVGEPQPGVTCGLSAHSGLPALSAPAGFTNDGLPVGIEFLGRPFADVRLVSLAFALEALGTKRRAPSTTPRLVAGRSPAPVTVSTVVERGAERATSRFTFDQLANVLRFDLRVRGVAPGRLQAVVLARRDTPGGARVIYRMSGPGMTSANGQLPLSGIDRDALVGGRLSMQLHVAGATAVESRVAGFRLR